MNLGYYEIKELGDYISNFLKEKGITKNSNLIINVDKYSLAKIDEDIYYRMNPDGKDYQQADNTINLMFDNLNISIKSQENN